MGKKRAAGKAKQNRRKRRKRLWLWLLSIGVAVAALYGLSGALHQEPAAASPTEFTDVRRQTREFMAYYERISLTPEQEAVKREALTDLKAPCCSDRTAHTCCCQCNMARSWWGLSKHLIANEGYGAQQVRAAVEGWFDFINPRGFTGDACYTGGCNRPFHSNGCGGMNEDYVVF